MGQALGEKEETGDTDSVLLFNKYITYMRPYKNYFKKS